MTIEQEYILSLLADFINGKKTQNIPENLDFNQMKSLTKRNEIDGILFYQIGSLLKYNDSLKSFYEYYENRYCSLMSVYQQRLHLLNKINDEFVKESIDYFVFKGIDIAANYSLPFLRSMGDTDILVKENNRKKAHTILLNLGFVNKNVGDNEWIYYYDKLEFELHCRLMNESETCSSKKHKKFMNDCWNYTSSVDGSVRKTLDINYHFVFLILHLRKHLINSGVGIRHFLDLAVINKTGKLDFEKIVPVLKQLEVYDFAKFCFALCEKWFDTEFLYKDTEINEEFFEEATTKVLVGGIFGFNDVENSQNRIMSAMDGKNKFTFVITRIITSAFPSYKTLCNSGKYDFLIKRPYLLPCAWIVRLIRATFNHRVKVGIDFATEGMYVDKNLIDSRKEFLNQWKI